MTWREEWAAGLTREQRDNLRSWKVDVPDVPEPLPCAHEDEVDRTTDGGRRLVWGGTDARSSRRGHSVHRTDAPPHLVGGKL